MAEKIEGSRFQVTLEEKGTWVTKAETSGTDSQATRMNFFIGMPYPLPAQEGQAPAEAQSQRA